MLLPYKLMSSDIQRINYSNKTEFRQAVQTGKINSFAPFLLVFRAILKNCPQFPPIKKSLKSQSRMVNHTRLFKKNTCNTSNLWASFHFFNIPTPIISFVIQFADVAAYKYGITHCRHAADMARRSLPHVCYFGNFVSDTVLPLDGNGFHIPVRIDVQ